MDHYLEITVLPDPEFSEGMLIGVVFSKLHRALVDVGHGEIGISFPNQKKTLGNSLRLHGTESALKRLMAVSWLPSLSDYTRVSEIQRVPDAVEYRMVKRVQVKSNAERLRRRSVKNARLTEGEAEERIQPAKEKRSSLPFLHVKSNSNGEAFRLLVEQTPLQSSAMKGKFSNYGLSAVATIPYF